MTLRFFFLGDGPARRTLLPWQVLFGLPLIGWVYAVWIASETSFLDSAWYTAAHLATDSVATLIPGIQKTERELAALGYPERALLVKHNLAMIWITGGLSWLIFLCLVRLPKGELDSAMQRRQKWAARRNAARQMRGWRLWAVFLVLLPLTLYAPFIGGASYAGRRGSWDFVNDPHRYFPFVIDAWVFFLFALSFAFVMLPQARRRLRRRYAEKTPVDL